MISKDGEGKTLEQEIAVFLDPFKKVEPKQNILDKENRPHHFSFPWKVSTFLATIIVGSVILYDVFKPVQKDSNYLPYKEPTSVVHKSTSLNKDDSQLDKKTFNSSAKKKETATLAKSITKSVSTNDFQRFPKYNISSGVYRIKTGTYYADKDIIIQKDGILVIEPGSIIYLKPSVGFTVYGQIIANGYNDKGKEYPIIFTSKKPSDNKVVPFKGFYFPSRPVHYSEFRYCKIGNDYSKLKPNDNFAFYEHFNFTNFYVLASTTLFNFRPSFITKKNEYTNRDKNIEAWLRDN